MQIEVKDHIINYKVLNQQLLDSEKPVLIFLHEGLGSISQFKYFPQLISDMTNLPAIIYDRIGYGLSSERKLELNADYLHDEALIYLPELLINLNINNKVILVGHSDGATISLLFASFFPEKVIGVVSEAAHVIVEDITVNGIKNLKDNFYKNPALMKGLKKYHGAKTEELFLQWTDLWLTKDIKEWNIEKELKNITSPVLVIQGENDEFGSYSQLECIKNHVNANVELSYFAECGHVPHFEKENEVKILIQGFIEKICNKNI